MHRVIVRAAALAAVVAASLAAAAPLQAVPPNDRYAVTPLVSNIPGVGVFDANLSNPWGLTSSTTSPWWVSDNGANKSTLYTGAGAINSLVVGVDAGPTGTVFTGIAGQFQVGTTAAPTTLGPSNFAFASQDGKIRAWRGGSTAGLVVADRSSVGASYTGLAIAGTGAAARIYAADLHNSRVDVFDGSWALATPIGAFVDKKLPAGYSPFGIQTIQRIGGTRVFVAYAKLDAAGQDEEHGPGLGIVDVYDTNGVLLHRVTSHGGLNAPWGLTQAPASFGPFAGDLLIGNFGDGVIQVFKELPDGSFDHQGVLRDKHGLKIQIDGLWALEFGNAGSNAPADSLFYTAGPNDEADGVFGAITPISPPAG